MRAERSRLRVSLEEGKAEQEHRPLRMDTAWRMLVSLNLEEVSMGLRPMFGNRTWAG